MADKYYIRPRKADDPKQWKGPFNVSQLKDQAERRLFSKELHEYSEDRISWISAREIWPTLFPKNAKVINALPKRVSDTPMSLMSGQAPNPTTSESPAEFSQQENAEWFYESNGTQLGPFTVSQLREFAAQGQLKPTDLIWLPGLGEQWIEAQSNPILFQSANLTTTQTTETAASGSSPWKAPPFAVASFALGILGMSCLPIIGCILAIIFGHISLMQLGRPGARKDGKWMAITGLVLGYVGIVVNFVAALILIGVTVGFG